MLYTIRAELDVAPDIETADAAVDALTGYHPAVGLTGPRLVITVSLPAESLSQAVTSALAVIETRTAHKPVSVVAATAEHHDRVNGLTPLLELVSVTEAAETLGLSRQALLQQLAAGRFETAQKVGSTWAIARSEVRARLGEAG